MARWRTDLARGGFCITVVGFLRVDLHVCISAGGVVVDLDLPYREDVKIEISSIVGLFGYSMADEVWRGDIPWYALGESDLFWKLSSSFLTINRKSIDSSIRSMDGFFFLTHFPPPSSFAASRPHWSTE